MTEEFSSNTDRSAPPAVPELPQRDREPVRILVSGSHFGIRIVIHTLHRLGFAEAGEWSRPQVEPKTKTLISVLTKFVSR